jgi:pyruvate, water dikinase
MALLIMRVSGAPQGRYYYPQAAGVGLSFNPYVWHPDIDPRAGVVRLVFGLGTRAVDRSDDDYTRLVALNAPARRPEATFDEVCEHSQRRMDCLDLRTGEFVSRPLQDVLAEAAGFSARSLSHAHGRKFSR